MRQLRNHSAARDLIACRKPRQPSGRKCECYRRCRTAEQKRTTSHKWKQCLILILTLKPLSLLALYTRPGGRPRVRESERAKNHPLPCETKMANQTSACLLFACCICGVSAFSSLARLRVLSQARRPTCHFRIPFSSKIAGAVEGDKKLKKPTLFQGEGALSDVPRTMQVSNMINTPICTQTRNG